MYVLFCVYQPHLDIIVPTSYRIFCWVFLMMLSNRVSCNHFLNIPTYCQWISENLKLLRLVSTILEKASKQMPQKVHRYVFNFKICITFWKKKTNSCMHAIQFETYKNFFLIWVIQDEIYILRCQFNLFLCPLCFLTFDRLLEVLSFHRSSIRLDFMQCIHPSRFVW